MALPDLTPRDLTTVAAGPTPVNEDCSVLIHLDSTIIGKASDAQPIAASGSPLRCRAAVSWWERSATDIGYRDFVAFCGSGLLTAIVGSIEDRDQEIAPTMSRNQRFAIGRMLPQVAHTHRCGPANPAAIPKHIELVISLTSCVSLTTLGRGAAY